MCTKQHGDQKESRTFDKFLENAFIQVVIPDAEELDLSAMLDLQHFEEGEKGETILEHAVKQRKSLFIDETINVFIVLRTQYVDEKILKDQLSVLTIVLDTYVAMVASNAEPAQRDKQEAPGVLFTSTTVENVTDPLIVLGEASPTSKSTEVKLVCMAWSAKVHLNRTGLKKKTEESKLAISFSASLTLQHSTVNHPEVVQEKYMASGVPGSMNLLAAFKNDPSFQGNPPYLAASALVKYEPLVPSSENATQQSRTVLSRQYSLASAFTSNLQICPTGASPSQARMFASLNFQVSPYLKDTISVQALILELAKGNTSMLGPSSLSLPLICHSGDKLSFIYDLVPDHSHALTSPESFKHTLNFHLTCSIHSTVRPNISLETSWSTVVDLSNLRGTPRLFIHHPTAPFTDGKSTITQSLSNLITLTITSPPTVTVGSMFRWSVLLANRSTTRTLRLALIPIITNTSLISPLVQPGTSKTMSATLTKSLLHPVLPSSYFTLNGPSITPPPANTSATTETHRHTASITTSTPDVRLGPLPPGTSATAELRFLALAPGVGGVRLVRVVDLEGEGERKVGQAKGEGLRWVDAGEEVLPDVVVLEAGVPWKEEREEEARKAEEQPRSRAIDEHKDGMSAPEESRTIVVVDAEINDDPATTEEAIQDGHTSVRDPAHATEHEESPSLGNGTVA